jgi:hypothetical protein
VLRRRFVHAALRAVALMAYTMVVGCTRAALHTRCVTVPIEQRYAQLR